MNNILTKFLLRWLGSALGLWIAAAILGSDRLSVGDSLMTVIVAGLFLAIVNMFLKPILVLFSFPAIIFTLGIFMLVINAFLIVIVDWLYGPFDVQGFGSAIWAGIIVGLVNYLLSHVLKEFHMDEAA